MLPYISTFIFIYLIALVNYIFSKFKGSFKKRAVSKIILSSLFLLLSVLGYTLNHSLFDLEFFKLLAIVCAFIGDIVFLYSFKNGGLVFLLTNIFLVLYQLLSILLNKISILYALPIILIFISLYVLYMYTSKKTEFNWGDKKKAAGIYLFAVTLSGALATILLITTPFSSYLSSIGIILFMFSDYILMTYKFKYNNSYLICANSITYFIGYLLIAMSLL